MATRNIKITYVAHVIFVLYNADLSQFYEDPTTSLKVSVIAFAGENYFSEIPMTCSKHYFIFTHLVSPGGCIQDPIRKA